MTANLKELYEETVASQIKIWDDEIEHLDARADILMAQMEDRYYRLIRSLRSKEKELKEQLALLRATCDGNEDWQTTRARLVHTTEDMKVAICRAEAEIAG